LIFGAKPLFFFFQLFAPAAQFLSIAIGAAANLLSAAISAARGYPWLKARKGRAESLKQGKPKSENRPRGQAEARQGRSRKQAKARGGVAPSRNRPRRELLGLCSFEKSRETMEDS
jgi:hypothetical protein